MNKNIFRNIALEIFWEICVYCIENVQRFLDNQDRRKAPDNRVNDYHFMDIANKGAERLKEKMIRR